jgi:hypothetical protein
MLIRFAANHPFAYSLNNLQISIVSCGHTGTVAHLDGAPEIRESSRKRQSCPNGVAQVNETN